MIVDPVDPLEAPMAHEDERTERPAPRRSRSGTVEFLKSALDAYKEANDEKEQFVRERLEAEAKERDKRSEALYSLSEARAADMQKTIHRLWGVIVVQVLIIAALAGVTVTGVIPGIGEFGASSDSTSRDDDSTSGGE